MNLNQGDDIVLTVNRHEKILNYVNDYNSATLQQLCDLTGASESTIRRDLSTLESLNKLKRVHGGAQKITRQIIDQDMTIKQQLFHDEKVAIAKAASKLITEESLLFIDAGSSTYELIAFLPKHIHVVTNGLNHAHALLQQGINTTLVGGQIKMNTQAIIGYQAIKMLEQLNFDIAFIGANGIDLKAGFTTPDSLESNMKQVAISQSKQSFILADESKFNGIAFHRFAQLDECEIITNKDNPYIKQYSNMSSIHLSK